MPAPRWLPILATLTMLTACDSSPETPPSVAVTTESFIAAAARIDATSLPAPVSYTHLTLPTIYSV